MLGVDTFRTGGLAKSFDVSADQILSADVIDPANALYQRTWLHRLFFKDGIFG